MITSRSGFDCMYDELETLETSIEDMGKDGKLLGGHLTGVHHFLYQQPNLELLDSNTSSSLKA